MFTIYTTSTCAYCEMVKKFFTLKGVQYQEVNVENDLDKRKHASKLSGMTSVPVVSKVENGQELFICVGWNPKLLMQAI